MSLRASSEDSACGIVWQSCAVAKTRASEGTEEIYNNLFWEARSIVNTEFEVERNRRNVVGPTIDFVER
jgi:hypothetical protein